MKIRKGKHVRPRRFSTTWTKNITRDLLIIGVIGGFFPYVLSLLDKQPVETIGVAWITEIVAVALGYFVRGFKDTKAEEDMKFKRESAGLTTDNTDDTVG